MRTTDTGIGGVLKMTYFLCEKQSVSAEGSSSFVVPSVLNCHTSEDSKANFY